MFYLACPSSKYVLVRYEDVTQAFQLAAAYIYCSLGLGEVPATVSTWVERNSKLTSCSEPPPTRRFLAAKDPEEVSLNVQGLEGGDCEHEKKEATDKMGTKRDSASMTTKWRSETTEGFSRSVWEACQDSGVMTELRYSF